MSDLLNMVFSLDAKVNGGSFTTDGNNFEATVLGVSFRVARRPIVKDGHFSAIEYAFITRYRDEDISPFKLYLSSNGNLFLDGALSNRLCDFDNHKLLTHLIPAVASVLMASPIFKP